MADWTVPGPNVAFPTYGLRLPVSELTDFVAKKVMKTAGRENPNHRAPAPRTRAPGAVAQNSSRSVNWEARKTLHKLVG
jgi:hypothetical protein